MSCSKCIEYKNKIVRISKGNHLDNDELVELINGLTTEVSYISTKYKNCREKLKEYKFFKIRHERDKSVITSLEQRNDELEKRIKTYQCIKRPSGFKNVDLIKKKLSQDKNSKEVLINSLIELKENYLNINKKNELLEKKIEEMRLNIKSYEVNKVKGYTPDYVVKLENEVKRYEKITGVNNSIDLIKQHKEAKRNHWQKNNDSYRRTEDL